MNKVTPHREFAARRDRLIREIESAFQAVQRLDGITLHEAMVLDNYGSVQDQQAARNLDSEDHWQDVPDHGTGTKTVALVPHEFDKLRGEAVS